jgi:hypothetical protein
MTGGASDLPGLRSMRLPWYNWCESVLSFPKLRAPPNLDIYPDARSRRSIFSVRNDFVFRELSIGSYFRLESDMSVKGQIKEAAGFTKEEAYEHGKSADSKEKAQEGRNLRNEGRVEDGKAPKTTEPGTEK